MKTLNAWKVGLALTVATFVGLATSQPANALSYSLTDLSVLLAPDGDIGGLNINDLGQFIGYTAGIEGSYKAFFWDKNSEAMNIGTLGVNYESFSFYDFNNLGQVIGSVRTADEIYDRPFFWDKNTGLLDIDSLIGGTFTDLRDINNLGQVVGFYASNSGSGGGFLWDKNTGILDLGTGVAQAINDQSQVVGYEFEDRNIFNSFIWDKTNGRSKLSGNGLSQLIEQGYTEQFATDINNSGQVLIKAFVPEFDESGIVVYWDKDSGFIKTGFRLRNDGYTLGINDNGQIVGSRFNDNRFGGYVWEKNTGGINLDFFPSGFNNLGQVVGQSSDKAYLWDKNTGAVDLDQVVSSFGWSIEYNPGEDGRGSLRINDAGQILGTGFFNGERRAFLLTPDSSPTKSVPEPSTALGLLAFSAFAAAFLGKRQRQQQKQF